MSRRFLAWVCLLGLGATAFFMAVPGRETPEPPASPRGTQTSIRRSQASADGRFLAVECLLSERPDEPVWVVDLSTRTSRPVPLANAILPRIPWSPAGELCVRAQDPQSQEPSLCWLDPKNLAVRRSAPDRDWVAHGVAPPRRPEWWVIERVNDGERWVDRLRWPAKEITVDFDTRHGAHPEPLASAGQVLASRRKGEDWALEVHRLESGDRLALFLGTRPIHWSVSPNGNMVAVGDGEVVQVIDLRDGRAVIAPRAGRTAMWIGGSDRHVLIALERDSLVVELDRNRVTLLEGIRLEPGLSVELLADERLILTTSEQIALHSAEGKRIDVLFPSPRR